MVKINTFKICETRAEAEKLYLFGYIVYEDRLSIGEFEKKYIFPCFAILTDFFQSN
jgi:hypothetical protein